GGYFLRQQLAVFPRRQQAEPQRPHADAHEPLDKEPERLKHAPDLAIAPFVELDFQPGFLAERLDDFHLRRRRPAVFQPNAFAQPLQVFARRPTADLDAIDFFDFIARMHELLRELAVVREKQQPRRVEVESAYWKEMALCPEALEPTAQVRPALRIAQRRDHPRRLVQQHVAQRRARDQLTVDFDLVLRGVGLRTELRDDGAVDGYASLRDPFFRFTARREARASENLLQALHG